MKIIRKIKSKYFYSVFFALSSFTISAFFAIVNLVWLQEAFAVLGLIILTIHILFKFYVDFVKVHKKSNIR